MGDALQIVTDVYLVDKDIRVKSLDPSWSDIGRLNDACPGYG